MYTCIVSYHIYVIFQVFLSDEVQRNQCEIIFALEPEAGALYYMLQNDHLLTSQINKSYLIVDCGGGTIDIVAHQMTRNENGEISIKELAPPHGSSSGGFEINNELENLICELCNLSIQDMGEIKTKYSKEWNKTIDTFELAKTYVDPDETFVANITLPKKIYKYIEQKSGKTMEQLTKQYKNHKVEWDDDDDDKGLILPYTTMYSLFQPVISRISVVIKTVLQKPECSKVNEIILVGGFAASHLLFQEISSIFPDITVRKNDDPLIAVLKGAVQYGIHRKLIKSRKSLIAIGIETCVPFIEEIHNEQLKISINGNDYCKGIFLKCIEINESIEEGTIFEQVFQPLGNASCCKFTIYGSQSGGIKYVSSKECYPIAHFEISDLSRLQQDRKIKITLNLGGTEMKVSACNPTNNDIKLPVKYVDTVHGNTLGLPEALSIDIRSL